MTERLMSKACAKDLYNPYSNKKTKNVTGLHVQMNLVSNLKQKRDTNEPQKGSSEKYYICLKDHNS